MAGSPTVGGGRLAAISQFLTLAGAIVRTRPASAGASGARRRLRHRRRRDAAARVGAITHRRQRHARGCWRWPRGDRAGTWSGCRADVVRALPFADGASTSCSRRSVRCSCPIISGGRGRARARHAPGGADRRRELDARGRRSATSSARPPRVMQSPPVVVDSHRTSGRARAAAAGGFAAAVGHRGAPARPVRRARADVRARRRALEFDSAESAADFYFTRFGPTIAARARARDETALLADLGRSSRRHWADDGPYDGEYLRPSERGRRRGHDLDAVPRGIADETRGAFQAFEPSWSSKPASIESTQHVLVVAARRPRRGPSRGDDRLSHAASGGSGCPRARPTRSGRAVRRATISVEAEQRPEGDASRTSLGPDLKRDVLEHRGDARSGRLIDRQTWARRCANSGSSFVAT